jgi:uncharacterized protein YjiS (DUF1127 family)
MTMQADTSSRLLLHHAVGRVSEAARGVATGFVLALARLSRRAKVARMQSVLSGMSDAQLHTIGVTRSGIRRHAEIIVGTEYDGL